MEGIINVKKVMEEAQTRQEARKRWRAVIDRIEEQEALYWLHRAEDRKEREKVKGLYHNALRRYGDRKFGQN